MKKISKRILKKILSRYAGGLGYIEFVPVSQAEYGKNKLLENFFSILKQVNFDPVHIVDIGANHGTWTRETLKYFPDAYYTLLEPQAQMQASIKDIITVNPRVKFFGVGAGKTAGSFKFTIADRDDSCSFSYSEEEASKLGFQQIDIPVVTLNDFLADKDLPQPGIIKIDAEGLDLDVLEGANKFFGKTEIFMVEASVAVKSFENSVLKMITFMDKQGYRFFDVTDLNRTVKHGALWLMEIVFVKKGGLIDTSINSYN